MAATLRFPARRDPVRDVLEAIDELSTADQLKVAEAMGPGSPYSTRIVGAPTLPNLIGKTIEDEISEALDGMICRDDVDARMGFEEIADSHEVDDCATLLLIGNRYGDKVGAHETARAAHVLIERLDDRHDLGSDFSTSSRQATLLKTALDALEALVEEFAPDTGIKSV